jgi:hypothetical protein
MTENIIIQQVINQVTVSSPGPQGPPGSSTSAASAQYATSASIAQYAASAGISSSVTQTNFNVLTLNNASVATINYVVGLGYQTSSGSVAYATNSGSSSYSSSAGYSPAPASVSYAASAGSAPVPASVSYSASSGQSSSVNYSIIVASANYAASAGAAPIPASVLYSASTGIANNSINLGGQASSYYYPASSITAASVSYATNSGSSNYSSSAGSAPIPASVSYSASSGLANNSTNLGGQASTYYYPASSINAASVAYATNSGSSLYSSSAGAAPIPASVSYSASSGTANNSINFAGQAQSYYAPISSPNFTGTPLAPTAPSATNTTQIATTAFVRGEITNLVNSAPTTLDTLSELAAALGNDPNFATTTASLIGLKSPINNPSFTGVVNLGSSVATGSVSSALNSSSLAGQPGSYYYPASSITAASVAYATNAGNSLTTSQTNFLTLTISSSNVATQAYVNNQGYLISSGSIASASNSASLGGIPAASYAQLTSPTFTGAPLAPTAASGTATTQIATTQFVQSAIATQSALTASTGYTGYFYQTATVPLTIGTASAIPWNGSTAANGVTFNGSSVTFTYPGYYTLNFGLQLNGSNSASINAWYRKNGVDVPNTNYESVVNNQTQYQLMQGVYTGSFSSGDIVQVMALTTGAVSSLLGQASSGTQPAAPAAILNISQITYIQQGSSISGGSATNVTFVGGSANFNTASISGSALATQAFVTSQGYLTSSGSIANAGNATTLGGQSSAYYYPSASITVASVAYATSAGNATNLGGQGSSYYYPSASITNASVAYATNAGNSASTSQTNFSSLTVSGSSVATQNYVNNKFFYETIPFSVTGVVSTTGPWDYRFYNDTGGTRSITGVRASLGTAPSGSAMIIDVRKNGITGANSIFTASGISIPSGSTTSGLISSGFNSGSSVASGDYLTVAVTQVDSTTAGSDLVVQVMWS